MTDPCECVCVHTRVCDVSVFRDHLNLHNCIPTTHPSIRPFTCACESQPCLRRGFRDTTLNETDMGSVLTGPYISVREQKMNSDRNKSGKVILTVTNESITSRSREYSD